MKYLMIAIMGIYILFDFYLEFRAQRQSKKPLSEMAFEIYDEATYKKWYSYTREKNKISLYGGLIGKCLTLLLLIFNGYYFIYELFEKSGFTGTWLNILTVISISGLTVILDIIFDAIITFSIESKYDFNQTNVKTFIIDKIISSLVLIALFAALVFLLDFWFSQFKAYALILMIATMLVLVIGLIILAPLFRKMFNKFTPLEASSLKTKIETLAKKLNFNASNIYVMNASKRSNKVNAYFEGFGKKRKIVLYDTLIEKLTEDEIVSVLAHEIGHAVHKDTLKIMPLGILNFIAIAVLLYLIQINGTIAQSFGFSNANAAFTFLLTSELIPIVFLPIGILNNVVARKAEYAADKFAAIHTSTVSMESALKTLATSNLSNLNPDKVNEFVYHNHPNLLKRITAIRRYK